LRDPKRIARICKILQKVWSGYSDQRLGQLLANYVFGHHVDIFFQEDDISEKALDDFYKHILQGTNEQLDKEYNEKQLKAYFLELDKLVKNIGNER